MPKPYALGIDLGTTYSAVARIDETGRTVMVRNAQGDILTPSVVLFDDQEIVVGKEAKKAVGIDTDRVAECVKRDMGQPVYSRPIRGENLPPEVIQSCILKKLKDDAVKALGPDAKAVITVPAYFDEPRRKATSDAGEMAGLEVLDIVNEPTAAALAFGEHLGYLDPIGSPRETIRVLVYDLGGGTFDVTAVELRPGDLRTLATDGDVQLGGRDWDERMANYVAGEFERELLRNPRTDKNAAARLMRSVEEAKHTLSVREQATVHVEFGGQARDISITRAKFEELCEDLLERTSYTTRQVLASAGLQWSDVSHVLLVGGSTRMPMVSRMLETLSGRKPQHQVHPDEAVARGAAIFAGYLLASRDERMPGAKFKVTDVNSHSLGIEGLDQRTGRKENVILIPRNTALPFQVMQKFVTKAQNQPSVVVQVLEGESKAPEQCTPIARAVMRQLPANLPKGTKIEVSYEYGTNGRLSVHAKVRGTANQLKIELEREGGLSEDRLARWKRIVTGDDGFDAFGPALREMPTPAPRQIPLPAMPTGAGGRGPSGGEVAPRGPVPAGTAPRGPIPINAAAASGGQATGSGSSSAAAASASRGSGVQSAPIRLTPKTSPAAKPTLLDDGPIELDSPAPARSAVQEAFPAIPFNRPLPRCR